MRLLITSVLLLLLGGCSAIDMTEYSANKPALDLVSYFQGKTTGWGIVQDRKGALTRQFVVHIDGTVDSDGNLTLVENFDWSDGEKTSRTWVLSRLAAHKYTGKAEDVIDSAIGTLYGNVLNWQYILNLQVDDTNWKIKFDDWMFLVSEDLLLNKAIMSKFGFKVGEVTLVFQKTNGSEG